MNPFRLDGSFCFAKVPPGFEIRYELYDHYPDGSKNMLIRISPIPLPDDAPAPYDWEGQPEL